MNKCRVCFAYRKNLRSIFETDKNISYAHMITSVVNIKIVNNEINNKICLSCCRRLIDTYTFKNLIERSEIVLQQTANKHVKRIYFDDIKDVKIKIELSESDCGPVKKYEDVKMNFENGENSICYKDTTIKKLNSSVQCTDKSKPLDVMEFLETIKDEMSDDYNNHSKSDFGLDSASDGYVSDDNISMYGKAKKVKYNKKNSKKKKWKKENILIKPIYLEDYKLIKTKPILKPRKKKYDHYLREDICPYCGIKTKKIKKHILVHIGERKFKCDKCSKGFFTARDLSHHEKKHIETRNFKCDKCIAAFNNKYSLQSHMLSHVDDKKHECNICKKAFKWKKGLMRHILMHNSANKRIKCELCNMSFFTKSNLRHHMRIHTGERPYNCELCSQPYSYKHDFNRHCFKKHGVFLKRRSVYVMNEEVLKQEQALMKDLMLRMRGIVKDGENLNPFEGPQAAQAFAQAIKDFKL